MPRPVGPPLVGVPSPSMCAPSHLAASVKRRPYMPRPVGPPLVGVPSPSTCAPSHLAASVKRPYRPYIAGVVFP
jgi:hypothetical protein